MLHILYITVYITRFKSINKVLFHSQGKYQSYLPGKNGLGALPPVPTPTPTNSSVLLQSQTVAETNNDSCCCLSPPCGLMDGSHFIKFQ